MSPRKQNAKQNWEKIQVEKCSLREHEVLTSGQTPTPIRMAACDGAWKVEAEDLLVGWLDTQVRAPD